MEFDYPLPQKWRWATLAELADPRGRSIVSGPFGSNIGSKFFTDSGVPVIRGNNLTTGSTKFVDSGFVFVTPEKAKELGNVDAVADDILFTAAGTIGQVGIIPTKTLFPLYIISNKQMRVRLNREIVDPLYEVVIGRVLELDPTEFELLVKSLLEALGFEAEHSGKTGDGGVDVRGTLDVDNFARIRVFVQAKRYQTGAKIAASVVRQLRQTIPNGAQGAFITTADYQAAARDVAEEAGFPRIGLINGRQMVDLLVKHWVDIPPDFKTKLGLQPGLVLA